MTPPSQPVPENLCDTPSRHAEIPKRRYFGRKWRIVALIAAGAVGVIALVLNLLAPAYLPKAILWGPNTGKNIDPAADPTADELRALGVSGQGRIAVGPPPASL